MTTKRIAILISASIALSGCFPAPHRSQVIPEISGVVTQNGRPVTGAEIRVRYRYGEDHTIVIGKTNAQGEFSYSGKKKFHLFVFIGDPGYDWTLIIQSQASETVGFADKGLGYVPEHIRFTCKLGGDGQQQVCITR